MAGVFPEPRIASLLVVRMGDLLETPEGEEDVREGLESSAGEEGGVTGEQYQRQEAEREPRSELSG